MLTEATSEKVGPSNVVLGRDWEQHKARFAAVGRQVEKWIVLQSTLDPDHEDCSEVWLGVEFGEPFAERIKKDHLMRNNALCTCEHVWCSFGSLDAVWMQDGHSLDSARLMRFMLCQAGSRFIGTPAQACRILSRLVGLTSVVT
jgi:hypothetical protein